MNQSDTIPQADSLLPFYLLHEAYPQPEVDTCTGVPLDSIFRLREADTIVERPSLFTGHGLVRQHENLAARTETAAPSWLFAVVVLLCAALWLYHSNRKIKLGELLKSTIDLRTAERLLRGMTQRGSTPLTVAPLLAAALATAIWSTAMQETGFVGWLLLTAGLTAAYLLRNGLLRLLASVFDRSQTMSLYINCNYLYHTLLATLAAPLLFALLYIPSATNIALWSIAIIAALVFILRFARGVQLFLTKTQGFSLFLFYYLCTVEVIPLLVLLKWFISQ